MARGVLQDVVQALFGSAGLAVGQLHTMPITIPSLLHFGECVRNAFAKRAWDHSTAIRVVSVLRGILRRLSLSPAIIRATRLAAPSDANRDAVLPKRYASLALDHPVRALLERWKQKIATFNYSDRWVREILLFYSDKVLPALSLSLCTFAEDEQVAKEKIANGCQDECILRSILSGCKTNAIRKLGFLRMFLCDVLEACDSAEVCLPKAFTQRIERVCKRAKRRHERNHCSSSARDVHRFNKDQLQRLYSVCNSRKDVRDELFLTLLLTTGMRVGGFVKMKCADVADLQADGRWQARTEGKTQEKGGKIQSFLLTKRVQELLTQWLNRGRPLQDSSAAPGYVFPGLFAQSHVSTHSFRLRFRRMCKAAALHGPACHPHSLRHCFAHMMLELGNPVEMVARLLGHLDPVITQKYYLKESAAEVSERAILPWHITPATATLTTSTFTTTTTTTTITSTSARQSQSQSQKTDKTYKTPVPDFLLEKD